MTEKKGRKTAVEMPMARNWIQSLSKIVFRRGGDRGVFFELGGEGKRRHKRPLTAFFSKKVRGTRGFNFMRAPERPGKRRMGLKGNGGSYRLCTGKVRYRLSGERERRERLRRRWSAVFMRPSGYLGLVVEELFFFSFAACVRTPRVGHCTENVVKTAEER